MQNFELFVKSLQYAIVNSSESIRKRNESILDEYFYKESSEVILENKEYKKELYSLIQPIRSNDIFIEYVGNENLKEASVIKLDPNESTSSKTSTTREDDLLADFLLEAYSFTKKNNLTKVAAEKSNKELSNSKLYNNALVENIKKDNETREITLNELKIKKKLQADLENELRMLNAKRDEFLDKKQVVENDSDTFSTQLKTLDSNTNEYKKAEIKVSNLNKIIEHLSQDIVSIESEINRKKTDFDNEKLLADQIEIKLQGIVNSVVNNEQLQKLYVENLVELIEESSNVVKLIKSSKVDKFSIIELIKNSKRYIKKHIESLVPKTVRVNYPATFDFATPDNDKEYKTISTPVEVPLLTLVPISNYNIEKATFNANFKFDVVEDQVMIDFSKDIIEEGSISNNFGKLEIVLAPQQTPEGLKSLIESYENFLKRQII